MLPSVLQGLEGSRLIRGPLYKSTLLLAPALFMALIEPAGAVPTGIIGGLFFNYLLFLLFAYTVNDQADRVADLRAGKERLIGRLPPGVVRILIFGFAIANLAVGYGVAGRSSYLAWLGVGLLCGWSYSAPPLRLKGRKYASVLFPPLLGKVIPILMAAALLGRSGWWLWGLMVCEATKNAIDILFHQVVDYEADQAADARTYAVCRGKEAAIGALRALSYAGVAAAAMTGLIYGIFIPEYRWAGAVILAGGFLGIPIGKRVCSESRNPLIRLLPLSYLWFGAAVFMMAPLVLSAIAALRAPSYAALFVAISLITVSQTWFYLRYRYS
jgi:4-hydroxybenzoate polyprenyltransferase